MDADKRSKNEGMDLSPHPVNFTANALVADEEWERFARSEGSSHIVKVSSGFNLSPLKRSGVASVGKCRFRIFLLKPFTFVPLFDSLVEAQQVDRLL